MRSRVLAVVAAILAVAGVVSVALAFRGVRPGPVSSGPCPPGRGLGRVAFVRGGAVHVLDLRSCRDRVVASNASAPVRWSPDGRWIAFGRGTVAGAEPGGGVARPLGAGVKSWVWSPTDDVLAAVTERGGVVSGGPGRPVRRLAPEGWGAGAVAFDPSGRTIAVERGDALWAVQVASGSRRLVFRQRAGRVAPPRLAGWSPDGRWVLFWPDFQGSASLAADGLPLEAVPAAGGSPVAIAPTLLYDDFLSWCGDRLVATAGGSRSVTTGKRVMAASPPGWRAERISGGTSRSWFWPACSPDGSTVAMTSTPNGDEPRFGVADRTIWLAGSDGSGARRLIGREGDGVSDEFPRWSADGRWLLFVRRESRPGAAGRLYLTRVETGRVYGPLATLPGGVGYYGHFSWSGLSDWSRPA